jgi:hypothetical protein
MDANTTPVEVIRSSLTLWQIVELYRRVIVVGSRVFSYYTLDAQHHSQDGSLAAYLIYENGNDRAFDVTLHGVRQRFSSLEDLPQLHLPAHDVIAHKKSRLSGDFSSYNRTIRMAPDGRIQLGARSWREIDDMAKALKDIVARGENKT